MQIFPSPKDGILRGPGVVMYVCTIKIYGNYNKIKTITFVLVAKQSTSLTLNSSNLLFANCWMFKVIEFSFWHIFSFKAAMSVVLLMQQQLYILMRRANART